MKHKQPKKTKQLRGIQMTLCELQKKLGTVDMRTLINALRAAGVPATYTLLNETPYNIGPFLKKTGLSDVNEPLLTLDKAAKAFNLSKHRLLYYAKRGIVPCYRFHISKGSHYYFRASEIQVLQEIYIERNLYFWEHMKHLGFLGEFFKAFLDIASDDILTEKETRVMRAILYEGKSFEAVAQAMDITTTMVRIHFSKGKEKVREKVKKISLQNDALKKIEVKCIALEVENARLEVMAKKSDKGVAVGKFLDARLADLEIPESLLAKPAEVFGIKTLRDFKKIHYSDLRKIHDFGLQRMKNLKTWIIYYGGSFKRGLPK